MPPEVFTTPYSNPAGGSPMALRRNVGEGLRLLREAGWVVNERDGKLANQKSGEPFAVELLAADPSFERINLFYNRAQPEMAMPGLLEEEKKRLNRPVPELPIAEDNDAPDVKAGNGNGHHGAEAAVKSLNDSLAHFQQDAPTCPNCGHVAVRNGACYKCLNCGESLGCS